MRTNDIPLRAQQITPQRSQACSETISRCLFAFVFDVAWNGRGGEITKIYLYIYLYMTRYVYLYI